MEDIPYVELEWSLQTILEAKQLVTRMNTGQTEIKRLTRLSERADILAT